MSIVRVLAPVVLLVFAAGCGDQSPASTAASSGETAAPGAGAAAGDVVDLGGAVVDAPAGWAFHAPTSSMRLAEAEVPGPDGPALLTVFFFGPGGGGGVASNLQRWIDQVQADPASTPIQQQFAVDGFSISTVTVAGTLLPSGMGAGPSEPVPGSRLLGAVIEGPGGPWFLKMTGPQATVNAATADFDRMLRSVRAAAATT